MLPRGLLGRAQKPPRMVCPNCGTSVPSLEGGCTSCTRRVGKAFRGLLICFGLQQAAALLSNLLPAADQMARGGGAALYLLLGLAFLVTIVVSSIMTCVQMYRLASGMGSKSPLAWVLGMLLPVVSLLCLLAINSQATTWLQQRGLKVGLLGPSDADLDRAGD